MRIWHQSFTDLDAMPLYRDTLQRHADATMAGIAAVSVHGLRPGTYPAGIAPMACNSHGYLRALGAQQVCEAAMAAERAGYDAFALGCFFDPGLHEARGLVDIPVVSLAESCMLTACSLGRKFAMIALTPFQRCLAEDLAAACGMASRLSCVIGMDPPVKLFDLEGDATVTDPIKASFRAACREAIERGAEVIIPGDGVLNEFLVRSDLLDVDGASIMDSLGVLFHHAAFFANARTAGALAISRRMLYAKPDPAMLAHARSRSGQAPAEERDFSGKQT
ncbi:hypothetical protein BH09PSE6_BH09PSE6_00440 [soil metagenome]